MSSSMFLDGEVLGSYLASVLGLNRHYFTQAHKKNFVINATTRDINGFVFVKLPQNIRELIDSGCIACKIEKEDEAVYEYKYELSKNCIIGFWK